MPRIDFSAIDEARALEPVPPDQYRAKVDEVEETATQYGDEMWRLTLTILEGQHEGRLIFDNLVFNEKAYPRVKLVCSRLGHDVSGELDLTPGMLIGRTCLLTVRIENYTDDNGNTKPRNTVPFDGYDFDPKATDGGNKDDLPF